MILALVGQPNTGKSTLFNCLTGANQHVGNFPGVTVEQKSGKLRGNKDCTIVDLPGIYSLSSHTGEETVTRDFILQNHPDAIINIADATNIERNLYLTLQLRDLGIPMVLALNMMDEVQGNGGLVDVEEMAIELEMPVIPISAAREAGIEELVKVVVSLAGKGEGRKSIKRTLHVEVTKGNG